VLPSEGLTITVESGHTVFVCELTGREEEWRALAGGDLPGLPGPASE
jgi:hypothetical protein